MTVARGFCRYKVEETNNGFVLWVEIDTFDSKSDAKSAISRFVKEGKDRELHEWGSVPPFEG